MKKLKRNNKSNPDPYEDFVRSEELDPYESLIKSYERNKTSSNGCNQSKSCAFRFTKKDNS